MGIEPTNKGFADLHPGACLQDSQLLRQGPRLSGLRQRHFFAVNLTGTGE